MLTVYVAHDMFPHKQVPFGGRGEAASHLGGRSAHFEDMPQIIT